MSKILGYGVYSEIEGGYLANASPSHYSWDPAAACLYATPAEAWASAKRRGPGYAVAVTLVKRDDGCIEQEDLPQPMKAAPGRWLVCLVHDRFPTGPLYVTSLSRDGEKVQTSTERHQARGFSQQQAQALAARFEGKPGIKPHIEQVRDGETGASVPG